MEKFVKFVKFVVSFHRLLSLFQISRDWVVPAAAPRVAREDAFEGQPAALEEAVFPDGLDAVVGASRHVTTALPQPGRQSHLIESDQQYQELSGQLDDAIHTS